MFKYSNYLGRILSKRLIRIILHSFWNDITIAHLNARSLKCRDHDIQLKETMIDKKFDIFTVSETWLDNSVTLKFQITIFIVLTPQTRKVVESVPRFWGLIKLRLWATSHASRLLGSINYGWKFKCDWKPEVVHNLYSLQATRHFIAFLRYWHHRFIYLCVFLRCTCIHRWSLTVTCRRRIFNWLWSPLQLLYLI